MTEKYSSKKPYYWYKNIFLVAKIQKHLNNLNETNDWRERYYIRTSKKFNDSHVSPERTGRFFLNNKKTRIIPPLLCENRLHRTNYLISTNQSGLKTGDSCISHLLSITHRINESFHKGTTFKVWFFRCVNSHIKGIW